MGSGRVHLRRGFDRRSSHCLTKQGLDAATADEALAEAERIVKTIEPFTTASLEAEFNAETRAPRLEETGVLS